MHALVLLLALASSPEAAPDVAFPEEVASFIADREACDHFRGEPFEGDSPEQVQRRDFLRDSIDIHCSGTDRRLAALKKRYADNPAVLSRLGGYEVDVEGACN